MHLSRVAALIGLACGSCTFNGSIPSAVTETCDERSPCSAGFSCNLSTHLCVNLAEPAEVGGATALTFEPTGNNPLSAAQLTALGPLDLAVVQFSTSVPLASAPTLVASNVAFALSASNSTHYTFQGALTGSPADGCVPVTVSAAATSGVTGTFTLNFPSSACGLPIKTSTPAPPDVATVGSVIYLHDPWGSLDTRGTPTWSLSGAPGSVAEPGFVLAYGERNPLLLGAAAAGPGAAWGPALLPPADESVGVALADVAGNVSSTVRVRDVEVVTTLGQPEGTLGSLSSLRMKRVLSPPIHPADVPTRGPKPLNGTPASVTGAAYVRAIVPGFADPTCTPTPVNTQLIWDPGLQSVVQFGCSCTNGYSRNDLIYYSAGQWTDFVGLGGYGPAAGFYDPALATSVAVQSYSYFVTQDQGWADWSLVPLETYVGVPTFLFNTPATYSMAWSPSSNRALLLANQGTFGTDQDGGWKYGTWALLDPVDAGGEIYDPAQSPDAGPPGGVRIDYAMAFDPSRQQVMLVGGVFGTWFYPYVATSAPLRDTWLWNDGARRWDRLDAGVGPPLIGGGLAFDPRLGQMVAVTASPFAVYALAEGWQALPTVADANAQVSSLVFDAFDQQLVFSYGRVELPESRPAAALLADVSDFPTAGEPVTSVTLGAVAGGSGLRAGDAGWVATPGVQWLGWSDAGEWIPLGGGPANAAPAGSPSAGTLSLDAGEAAAFFDGLRGAFAVAPSGSNGTGQAQLTVAYVEARVLYRVAPVAPAFDAGTTPDAGGVDGG
ncbi:MAG TPA: hypothetical protein VH208_06700 [Myxococcaceae bacterium]|nr:hypothetical protein [Myxococcaceae bacterium]